MTKRTGERASEVQRSTLAAWYLSACFLVCLAGAVWLFSLLGVIDFGTGSASEASKEVARAAARRAAEQQTLARVSAQEEARDIAADAKRLIRVPNPSPPADPAASASSAASAANSASVSPQPAPVAARSAQQ